MTDWEEFIASGILEMYVWGGSSPEDDAEVKGMLAKYPEIIGKEIREIGRALEEDALAHTQIVNPIIGPFVLATADYIARLNKGEPFVVAPVLTETSAIADYEEWINREDMVAEKDFEGVCAKIISAIPGQLTTAIVWLRDMAPQETHTNEYERFLILEGTCDIHVEELKYSLKRGDYLQIPLYKEHHVIVTSSEPCKILLQRVAA